VSRRVLAAILTVTTLAIVVFAVPLALGARRLYRDEARTRLERSAQAAAARLASQLARTGGASVELPDEAGLQLAAYDSSGRLLDGDGPAKADSTVSGALAGTIGDRTGPGRIVVAVPVHDENQVIGAVRATVPTSAADSRAHNAWLAMAGLGLAVLGLAVVASRVAARRIARPVSELADAARRLGDGDFTVETTPSGIVELDRVGTALTTTARRLGSTLDRERAFSADASHQLRTPLTSLKIRLEATQVNPGADRDDAIAFALTEIERLEGTIGELLALARDATDPAGPLDVDALLGDLEARWHGVLAADGRPLRIDRNDGLPLANVAGGAVRHALDVLVDNAHKHGRGTVQVIARDAETALAIDVTDEGPGPPQSDAQLFERRSPAATGTGIGLAMARSLIEAQGGRLVRSRKAGTASFTVLLPAEA
jgi:signal transduction histidine kinase